MNFILGYYHNKWSYTILCITAVVQDAMHTINVEYYIGLSLNNGVAQWDQMPGKTPITVGSIRIINYRTIICAKSSIIKKFNICLYWVVHLKQFSKLISGGFSWKRGPDAHVCSRCLLRITEYILYFRWKRATTLFGIRDRLGFIWHPVIRRHSMHIITTTRSEPHIYYLDLLISKRSTTSFRIPSTSYSRTIGGLNLWDDI